MNLKVYDKWTDPWWGRSTSKGEIGCAISHYKLWEKSSKIQGLTFDLIKLTKFSGEVFSIFIYCLDLL